MVLFGTRYWKEIIDFEALIRHAMIDSGDIAIIHGTDSVEDAFQFVTRSLSQYALAERGAIL